MPEILDCLTRGLDLGILSDGFGKEDRGVVVSYQAQTPVLGAILPLQLSRCAYTLVASDSIANRFGPEAWFTGDLDSLSHGRQPL